MTKKPLLIPISVTSVTTTDSVKLSGVIAEPRGRKKAAFIWLPGLSSSFDSGQELMSLLSRALPAQGIGYFKFDTRGRHLTTWGSTKQTYLGSTHEKFRDCIKDIRAIIALAKKLGYKKIILSGHSTGASKVLYYTVVTKDRSVKAVLLAGPASDVAGELNAHSAKVLLKRVAQATKAAKQHPDDLVPAAWGPWSNQRYVSLYTPGSLEEIFPYHKLGGRWTYLKKLRQPVLMVSGEEDQYLTLPAKKLMELFRTKAISTKAFTGKVIPKASHGFYGQQPALVTIINRWLRTLSL